MLENQLLKISIITPSFNSFEFLERVILSVLSQGYPNLEYIIIDGGSTDGTIEIIKKYAAQLAWWVSEPDSGMYHALNKGFARATGEVMAWINADDLLHPGSLSTVNEIFEQNPDIQWLQGHPTVIDETNRVIKIVEPRFSPYAFLLGEFWRGYFIQQESSFWRRNLWESCGGGLNEDYRYAGDFELWSRFHLQAPMATIETMLGSFRLRRNGQFSSNNWSAYTQECEQALQKARMVAPDKMNKQMQKIACLKARIAKYPILSRYLNWQEKLLSYEADEIHFSFNKNNNCFEKQVRHTRCLL